MPNKSTIEREWKVRYYGGKTYTQYGSFDTMRQAQSVAKRLRGDGNLARVAKSPKGRYLVYVRAYLKGLP